MMTIQDWGAIGEIIGALGVIASLLYLAVQIRQNSKIATNATTQAILGNSVQMNTAVAGDIAVVVAKVIEGDKLNPEEELRFFAGLLAAFTQNWQAHYQHTRQMIEPEIFEAYERRAVSFLSIPKVVEWWRENDFRFSQSFRDYIEGLIERAA
jgi:hypothetical protein